MDPARHQRYLEYLELRQYFVRRGDLLLDPATFELLEKKLDALKAREEQGELTRDEQYEVKELEGLLLRD